MRRIAAGQASAFATPELFLITQNERGELIDPVSVSYSVWDISTAATRRTPVKVFPVGVSEPVNLLAGPVGDRLGKGRFVVRFATILATPTGRYEVRTTEKLTATSPEVERRWTFEVTAALSGPGYCSIDDLRGEGVSEEEADDLRLLDAIEEATRFVDLACGWFFEPRYLEVSLDGRNLVRLFMNMAIVAVESVRVESEFIPFATAPEETILLVYNRHIRQGLTSPDDRRNPKIELGARFFPYLMSGSYSNRRGSLPFQRGRQNVRVKGVFGFTEPDGSSTGRTPLEIRKVTMRLAMRELPPVGSEDAEDAAWRGRLMSESTAGQSYSLGKLASYGDITGDPEIDRILVHYRRPISMAVT